MAHTDSGRTRVQKMAAGGLLSCLFLFFGFDACLAKEQTKTAGGSKACSHTGFFSKKIVPLCEQHFPDSASKNLWVVLFYHPQVQKVHDGRGAFEELAADTSRIEGAKVGAVDCLQNNEFCMKQGVRSVPATRVMLQGNMHEFEGELTDNAEALLAFVTASVTRFREIEKVLNCGVKGLFADPKKDATVPLCTANFPPALDAAPWLVSFYDSGDRNKDKTMKGTMNKLAEKYGNSPPKKLSKKSPKVRFGAIECGHKDNDCEALGISSYPTVRFYRADAEPATFDSYFDKDDLKQWTDSILKSMPIPEKAKPIEADMVGSAEL